METEHSLQLHSILRTKEGVERLKLVPIIGLGLRLAGLESRVDMSTKINHPGLAAIINDDMLSLHAGPGTAPQVKPSHGVGNLVRPLRTISKGDFVGVVVVKARARDPIAEKADDVALGWVADDAPKSRDVGDGGRASFLLGFLAHLSNLKHGLEISADDGVDKGDAATLCLAEHGLAIDSHLAGDVLVTVAVAERLVDENSVDGDNGNVRVNEVVDVKCTEKAIGDSARTVFIRATGVLKASSVPDIDMEEEGHRHNHLIPQETLAGLLLSECASVVEEKLGVGIDDSGNEVGREAAVLEIQYVGTDKTLGESHDGLRARVLGTVFRQRLGQVGGEGHSDAP